MEKGLVPLKDLVIGDRTFEIPIYQRNYSWEKNQWEDLWNDLLYLDVGKRHYFGTLLMKETGRLKRSGLKSFGVYELIDGQQRLSTTLILVKEIMAQLGKIDDENVRAELIDLEKNYLKYREVYKLELLGDDSEFFRRYVIDDMEYPDEVLTPSQRRLKEAKIFFRTKLEEIKKADPNHFRDFLIQLKEKIDNLEIIRYIVGNDSDAVLIFETVNDRGKLLSRLEKTKSFLMHLVYLSEPTDPADSLRQVNESFSRIFRYLEGIQTNERGRNLHEEDIQRYHFVTCEAEGDRDTSYTYLDFLKGKIRDIYRSGEQQKCLEYVLEYTKSLEKAFFALKEIVTYDLNDEVGTWLKKSFTLERVAGFFPLLMETWIKFKNEKEKMTEILRLLEIFTLRVYVVGRRRADTGESRAYRLAYKVHRHSLEFDEITQDLKYFANEYENNEDFQRDIKVENFYSKIGNRDIKYILFEYEKYLREQAREPLEIDLDSILSEEFQIEHIWPQNPEQLPDNLKEIHEHCRDRLGNLTLASKSWNVKWGNCRFEIKREKYQDSVLRVQKELSNLKQWGKEQIEKREEQIAKFAMERWKI